MGCRYRLELSTSGHKAQVQEGEFSDDETKLLEMYLDQYEEIAASPALNSGLPCSIKVKWDGKAAAIDTSLRIRTQSGCCFTRCDPSFCKTNRRAS
jgi:hypothetical protein